MSKYFVTGGTGFIGNRIIQKLLEEGAQVTALIRRQSSSRLSIDHPNLQITTGDLSDSGRLAQAMEGCDFVFHVAGLARPWAPSESMFYKVNVDGTKNILSAARLTGIKKVIFTSTGGVFSPATDVPAHEDTPRDIPFFNAYEKSKAEAEQLVRAHVQEGQNAAIVNPTRVFGPGKISESNAVTKLIEKYVFGSWRYVIGDGQSIGNYTFIEDVVNGHLLAMEQGRPGERYILGGHNLSYTGFFEALAAVSGIDRKIMGIPMWLALTMGQFEQWKADSFGKPPIITPDWLKKYNYDWTLSSQKAVQELGYHITPLEEAFRKTIDWLAEKKGR